MKRLYILPAFLLIFMLGLSAASGDDSSAEAQNHIKSGIRLYEQGQSEVYANQTILNEAVEEFKKALSLEPDSAEAHYYLGLTCLAMDSRTCAEKQYQFLKDLDTQMAQKLRAQIEAYRPPTQFEHVGTKGEQWKAPKKEKASVINTPSPESSVPPESEKSCEIVSFSTYNEPGQMARFAQGGTIYEEPRQCVTATIKNTGTARVWGKDFMIEAHFSDGDTMRERIDGGVSGMNAIDPGGTVEGSACFKKEKATITVVECGMW